MNEKLSVPLKARKTCQQIYSVLRTIVDEHWEGSDSVLSREGKKRTKVESVAVLKLSIILE